MRRRSGSVAAPEPPPPPPPPPPVEAAPEPEPEVIDETEEEAVARLLAEDEKNDKEKISTIQDIYQMNAAQKVIQALKGSSADRAILIRDPNRIVSSAVLGSPRLNEMEIERLARL